MGFKPHRRHCFVVLEHFRHIYPSLVLVQPRKTRPCLTERLLMGHKESNQTKKQNKRVTRLHIVYFSGGHIQYVRNNFRIIMIQILNM